MKQFQNLMCVDMNNIIYKETILCFPSIILVILIGLVELLTIYDFNTSIILLLKLLIAIFTPSNYVVKSLLPGYIITIFMEETNDIIYVMNTHDVYDIIHHAKMWTTLYDFYYNNYIHILLPALQLSYTMLNTKHILHAINTHSWRLLFPFMLSNIIIIFSIMISSLLYFYYKSLNNISNIHRDIEINKSIINILSRDLSNIHNLIDNNEIEQFESKLNSIKTNLTNEEHNKHKINEKYKEEVYMLDYTLKTLIIICVLSIC